MLILSEKTSVYYKVGGVMGATFEGIFEAIVFCEVQNRTRVCFNKNTHSLLSYKRTEDTTS